MARGKYAHRKTNRDAQSLSDEIDALTTELALAEEQLRHALREANVRAELEATLRACIAERDTAIAPERRRVTRDIEILTDVLKQSRTVDKAIGDAWTTFIDNYIDQTKDNKRSGIEAIESMLSLTSGHSAIIDFTGTAARKKLGTEAAIRIDRARGERRADYTPPTTKTALNAAALAPRSLRPQWNAWFEESERSDTPVETPDAIKTIQRQWNTATVASLTPTTALAGHPHPVVDPSIDPEHPLARILGLDLSGPPSASPRTQPPPINQLLTDRAYYALGDPWETAEHLLPLWRSGRDTIRDTIRLPSPLHPSPRHPAPADAVSLRHWYSLAAAGAWARTDGTDNAHAYGQAAIALTAAANFWMPPGQVHGYLDSDPITAEDREHIRMAYPNVLLALGKPILLEPQPDPPAVDTELLERATLEVLHSRNLTEVRSWVLSTMTQVNALNVLDLIAARGARIEGILLLADDQGATNGHFAWCLAVPGRAGMLGRWVLPAHRDRTAYADQIDALQAVTAWADWHQPADPAVTTSSHTRSAALHRAAAAGGVHVLNAARTATAAARPRPTGRTVTAHIRRGHWRRQPVGVGRSQIRMVRVAPAVIGAGNLPRTAPIYRLPTNPAHT